MGASSRRRLASDPRPSGIGKAAAAVSEASRGPSRNLGGDAARGVRLPLRYSVGWYEPFEARLLPALSPGVRILDVGSGRQPALLPARRPPACTYVGLDISRTQLEQASAGSYDEVLEGDITLHERSLQNRFDLLVSWQVLEHVRPLEAALENMRLYLRPGGTMVSLLSGGRSVFALINRLVPHDVAKRLLRVLLRREPASVFPAHYDHCHYSALRACLTQWSSVEIEPLYRGASYLRFSRVAQHAYLLHENWLQRERKVDFATHYLVRATR